MAKLTGNIEFTGSLGGVTAYRMKGCDRIVLRRTAGPTKHQINNNPRYKRTKENKQEFGGVAKAAKHFGRSFAWLRRLADYNFQPTLNKVTKAVQKLDQHSVRGERNIFYSQHHDMLKGFNLNKYHPFDTIVQKPVTCTIDKEACSVTVNLPSLQRGINLNLPWPTPRFHFVVSLGVCDDLVFDGTAYGEYRMSNPQAMVVETAWQPADKPYAGETVTVQLKHPELVHNQSSLVVAIGIVFDMSHRAFGNDRYELHSLTGSAKILDLAVANPAPQPTLQLPVAISVPERAELADSADMLELLEQRKQANIVEGFKLQADETQDSSGNFYAAINVNHSRLWEVFCRLVSSLPGNEVCCVLKPGNEEPVTTGSHHKQQVLAALMEYSLELGNDPSLSFAVLLQTKDTQVKLLVNQSKYLQYWGVNRKGFEKQMRQLDIRPVANLEFVDAYPMVTEPLSKFFPNARDATTVIQQVTAALRGN